MAHVDQAVAIDPGDFPEHAAQANELRAELVAALNELGPEEHQAVALCVLGGLTQSAASELTGTNLNTIKARVRRGLDRLREKLKNRPDSVEAFLALPALPLPSGNIDGAVSRWSAEAKGGESAVSLTGAAASKTVLFACIALLVIGTGLNVAYNMLDFNRPSPEVGSAQLPPADSGADNSTGGRPDDTPLRANETSPEDSNAAADDSTSFAIDPLPANLQPNDAETKAGGLVVTRRLYPSGAVEFEGTALNTPNGQLYHGHFLGYYETGELKAEYTYVRGSLEGTWSGFHLNGKLDFRGEYAADKKHGFWTYYTETGATDVSGEYFEDKKVGTWTMFHPNGDHRRLDTYADGVLSGVRKDFHPGGVLFQTTEYANSQKNGLQIEYDPATGNIVRESRFKDGQKSGPDRLFDPATGIERAE